MGSADDQLRTIVDHLNHDDAAKALELLTPLVSVPQPSLAARFATGDDRLADPSASIGR